MPDPRLSALALLRSRARAFLACERGSATIWSLTWLLGFAIMAGVAIDSTNGWRHKTMLQSTADAAALAGAWELPESYLEEPYLAGSYTAAEEQALTFAGSNLTTGEHGDYFARSDITIGNWEPETRVFTAGDDFANPYEKQVNAVRVRMGESEARGNSVATALLHIVGLASWDVRTVATAVYGVPKCLQNGIIGREGVDLASNVRVENNVCVHGQGSVDVQNNIYWANGESLMTGSTPAGLWAVRDGQYDLDGNPIDLSTSPNRQNMYPPMVDRIPSIGRAMLRGDKHYRHLVYPPLDPLTTTPPVVIALPRTFREITGTITETASAPRVGTRFAGDAQRRTRLAALGGFGSIASLIGLSSTAVEDGRTTTYEDAPDGNWPIDDARIEHVTDGIMTTTEGAPVEMRQPLLENNIYFAEDCIGGDDGILSLSGTIRNITLVTNCKLKILSGAVIENAVLLSTDGWERTNEKSVEIWSGAQIGANSACDGWGGVRIYANGNITTPASGAGYRQWYGAHLIARNDIQFAGLSNSEKGISLYAGGEVKLAGNARIGALDGTLDETYPAGGCPEDGVRQAFGIDAYMPILVE